MSRHTRPRWQQILVGALGNIGWLPLYLYNGFLLVVLRDRRRFFPLTAVEGLGSLEEATPRIQAELAALRTSDVVVPSFAELDAGQERLAGDGMWQTFLLRAYGRDVTANMQLCPATTEAIRALPGVFTALFSVLQPGKELPAHIGPFKGVLRCQLALEVPAQGDVGLSVGGEIYRWREGRAVLFDDTYLHRAWNRSAGERVVLFLDLERPMPSRWMTWVNRWVMRRLSRTRRIARMVERAEAATRASFVK